MGVITCIDISEPVLHISSGKFTAGKHWKHKHMYHNGNFEIIIVIKGVVYLKVDDQHYQLSEGEIFALPPYHHLQGYKESPDNTQYFWFHFFTKPNGLKTIDVNSADSSQVEGLFKQDQAVLPLQSKVSSWEKIFILANQILDVAGNSYFTTMSVDYFLTMLVIELSQGYFEALAGAPVSEKSIRIAGIKEWIRANLNEKLKVHDVADAFDLNAHYLVRIFKQQTDQTVVQYINQLKLKKADELLLRTNLPIKQIADMVFYSDEKQFMKAFKKNFNLTPSEFRNAYSKKFLDSSRFDPEVPITRDVESYRKHFKRIVD